LIFALATSTAALDSKEWSRSLHHALKLCVSRSAQNSWNENDRRIRIQNDIERNFPRFQLLGSLQVEHPVDPAVALSFDLIIDAYRLYMENTGVLMKAFKPGIVWLQIGQVKSLKSQIARCSCILHGNKRALQLEFMHLITNFSISCVSVQTPYIGYRRMG
jgi:hypothetical protein